MPTQTPQAPSTTPFPSTPHPRSPRRSSYFTPWTDWLEQHWVNPDYKGWILLGLSAFFFLAATNTLAGWLYVMSGVSFALMAIAAYLSRRSLKALQVSRLPLEPSSAGQPLSLSLRITNPSLQAKTLLQVSDRVPAALGPTASQAIALIPAQGDFQWTYQYPAPARGVYRWDQVQLRTAAPLGLFWHRRLLPLKAKAVVYPQILPLNHCPLLDSLGDDDNQPLASFAFAQAATEGLTRALRPYRWGDSTRLIHWRTSARYGELRVRELETFQGGQDILLALDSAGSWDRDAFEEAVVAIASLYHYALQFSPAGRNFTVQVWTAGTGLMRHSAQVLEALAAVQSKEALGFPLPTQPLIWLTQNPSSLGSLPSHSRWLLWPGGAEAGVLPGEGLYRNPEMPLQAQLQA